MEDSPVEPRAKRLKKDKFGRFAALAKLKELKGSKHKYEIDEVDNVYDTVDEREYTKRVVERGDDWIVDDDGSGYVEDGREIFDDDLDAKSIAQASNTKGRGSKRKKKAVSENAGKGNLQYMISNMSSKKKEETKLEDDDVLSELISEIDSPSTSTLKPQVKLKQTKRFSALSEKVGVKDYMKKLVEMKPKPVPIKIKNESMDDSTSMDREEMEKPVFKENQNNLIETVDQATKTPVVETTPSTSEPNKLLFKIPTKKIEETTKIEDDFQEEMDFNFDDDFEFENVNVNTDEEKKPTKNLDNVEIPENFTTDFETPEDDFDESEMLQINGENEKNIFKFFWWDAYDDPKNQPGIVLLFGKSYCEKTKKFISCSVVVKNILRKIYLLPRRYFVKNGIEDESRPISIMDVYQEFNEKIASKLTTFKSRKVTKCYAFDSNIPVESEYLEVRFEGNIDISDREFSTFSHVFGLNSSFLEIFLLDRKIKGPCWLNISNYEISTNPVTHSAVEIKCSKPLDVSLVQTEKLIPPPPLTVFAINIKSAINPKTGANDIAMISCLINNRYYLDKKAQKPPFQDHFCVLTKLADQVLPLDFQKALTQYKLTRVQKMDTERALLNYFLAQFTKFDPDLIVGHDLNGYQITILADRLIQMKATNFSRLSRIKRDYSNYNKVRIEKVLFAGRLVCDVKISAKELIKARSYDLDTLCFNVLKIPEGQRIEIEPEVMPQMYEDSKDLFKTISLTMQDASYILRIMFELNVIPLALQITNIAGNIMSKTLMGGRSERNEFLLLHAFNEKDYIVPEKIVKRFEQKTQAPKRKKATYSGGLVLEPKVGFYDKFILLMDFNSLYPSIIQEYNICFTTLTDPNGPETDEDEMPDKNLPTGILPTEIRKLVESRRQVKNLMKTPDLSPDLYMQYHIRQMALKLTANSMYGCLGFSNSRFFAKKLAALVTQKGREILTNTRDIVQKLNFDVIYGDTDSIMINTNIVDYDQVLKIGKNIKQEINKLYRQVELDIDGVFKYLLLLKKKKYAAVILTKGKNGALIETQEHKGLDIVRRDWSQLAASAGKHILNHILSDQTEDERIDNILNYLSKLKEDLQTGKVPLPLLIITKQLTKDPKLYTDKNVLSHVQVALRNNKTKGKKLKAGDTVSYIVCKDGTNNPATQRAYLLEELKASSELSVDIDYYLAQQIHPVISRICEPVQGIDDYQIATTLGLDNIHFKKPRHSTIDLPISEFNKISCAYNFDKAEPFIFKCFTCQTENKLTGVLVDRKFALEKCSNLNCNVSPLEYIYNIQNQLVFTMRRYIRKYYKNELYCEDPLCSHVTNRMPLNFNSKYPVCTFCKKGFLLKVYSEDLLYFQLLYFQNMFDISKIERKDVDPKIEVGYSILKEAVDHILKSSGYATVKLSNILKIIEKGNRLAPEEYM